MSSHLVEPDQGWRKKTIKKVCGCLPDSQGHPQQLNAAATIGPTRDGQGGSKAEVRPARIPATDRRQAGPSVSRETAKADAYAAPVHT